MGSIRFRCVVSVFLLLLFAPSVRLSAENTLSFKDLMRGLEDAEATFGAYAVKANIDSRVRLLFGDRKGEYLSREAKVSYRSDSAGRLRVESEGIAEDDDAGQLVPFKHKAVFDGEQVRRLDGRNHYNSGEIVAHKRRSFYQGVDPRNFLTHIRGEPASSFLKRKNAEIVEWTEYNGRRVAAVATEPLTNDRGKQFQHHLLIDPSRTFAIVRRIKRARFSNDGRWIEYKRTEIRKQQQDASGLWLPTHVVHEEYPSPGSPDSNPTLLRQDNIEFRHWQLDPSLTEDTFALKFPSGILVKDKVRGRTFKTTEISEQSIADQAAVAKSVRTDGTDERSAQFWIFVASSVVGAGLIAGGIAVFALNRHRAR